MQRRCCRLKHMNMFFCLLARLCKKPFGRWKLKTNRKNALFALKSIVSYTRVCHPRLRTVWFSILFWFWAFCFHFNCSKYSPHAAIHFWSLSIQLKNGSLESFFQTTKPFFQATDWQVKNDKRKMKMVYWSCFSYGCWNVWKCWSSFSPIFVLVCGSEQDQVDSAIFSTVSHKKSSVSVSENYTDYYYYKWCILLQMIRVLDPSLPCLWTFLIKSVIECCQFFNKKWDIFWQINSLVNKKQ